MADKSIDQLNAAEKIYATDLFVLQQSGSAKKLTGQILLNWLTAAADGHGGIQSIAKLSTSGLVDTYRITLADTTTFDFAVTNGRSITGISKTSTSGLVDTYTISYNNGTTSKFTVTNGEKGDKGNNAYIWIKYASQEPTESSHSMGDLPDDWIGIYSGNASTAPTDWKQYKWFQIKGEKGDTGSPATLVTKSVTYQSSDSGTIIPSGAWGSSIPVVSQGKYLWTKTELQFNTGDPIVSYSVARMGIDGSGAVSSVAGVSPDAAGNVTLTAADVGALAVSGGDMTGPINMNGQPISGLNDPTADTQAARKGYVDAAATAANAYTDTAKAEANAYTDASVRKAAPRNLLDNSDFRNPVNQRGQTTYTFGENGGFTIDRWRTWLTGSSLTVCDGYISTTARIFQRIEHVDMSSTYTIAVKHLDGTISCFSGSFSNEFCETQVAFCYVDNGIASVCLGTDGTTRELVWAALYEGEYTAATLPEYHPKGYAAELLECQRYYYVYRQWVRACAKTNDLNTAHFNFQFPIPMRLNPALQYDIVEGTQPTLIVANAYGIESWSDAGTYTLNNISATADL